MCHCQGPGTISPTHFRLTHHLPSKIHQTLCKHYPPSHCPDFSKPALSLAKYTLQDRHRIQLDKLEMYCKHRMKLQMFKSKKMQLCRGKHTGSTWVHGKYIKKGNREYRSQQYQAVAKKAWARVTISSNRVCKNPKIFLPLHWDLICIQLDYLILAWWDIAGMGETIWEMTKVKMKDQRAGQHDVQGRTERCGTT